MTATETELGFTAVEFGRYCERIEWYRSCHVPWGSIVPYLDRCCEVELLTRRMDEQGSARYSPTPLLLAMFPE
jgi:hypothetical protein